MPEDMWKKVREQAGQVLGASFWQDLGKLLPQRPEPACDLFRWNDELIVVAEAAGLASPNDIQISLQGRQLHLRGNRERPFPVMEDDHVLAECRYGPFHRIVELPESVDAGSLTARYRSGMLTIRMKLQTTMAEQPVNVEFGEGHGQPGPRPPDQDEK